MTGRSESVGQPQAARHVALTVDQEPAGLELVVVVTAGHLGGRRERLHCTEVLAVRLVLGARLQEVAEGGSRRGRRQSVVHGPVEPARRAPAGEVVALLQRRLADGARRLVEERPVVVLELLAGGHGARGDGDQVAAVVDPRHVGVAAVVDEAQRGADGAAQLDGVRFVVGVSAGLLGRHQLAQLEAVAGAALQVAQQQGGQLQLLRLVQLGRRAQLSQQQTAQQVNGQRAAPDGVDDGAERAVGHLVEHCAVVERVVRVGRVDAGDVVGVAAGQVRPESRQAGRQRDPRHHQRHGRQAAVAQVLQNAALGPVEAAPGGLSAGGATEHHGGALRARHRRQRAAAAVLTVGLPPVRAQRPGVRRVGDDDRACGRHSRPVSSICILILLFTTLFCVTGWRIVDNQLNSTFGNRHSLQPIGYSLLVGISAKEIGLQLAILH